MRQALRSLLNRSPVDVRAAVLRHYIVRFFVELVCVQPGDDAIWTDQLVESLASLVLGTCERLPHASVSSKSLKRALLHAVLVGA
jgi:hypothetical protein